MRAIFSAGLIVVASAVAAQAVTFEGTATGSWSNPVGTTGFTINNNDAGGTADVNWGTPGSTPFNNLWSFDGVGSDGAPGWSADDGVLFKIGDFTYRNGSVSGHDFEGADLSVALSITSPLSSNETYEFEFDVINTPNNTGNPVTDGDIASIISSVSSQTFMYDGDEYTLELTGFSQDGGSTITTQFNSPEGSTANASLYGRIIPPAIVPLPAGLPLLAGALGLFGFVARRKKHS